MSSGSAILAHFKELIGIQVGLVGQYLVGQDEVPTGKNARFRRELERSWAFAPKIFGVLRRKSTACAEIFGVLRRKSTVVIDG